MKHQETPCSFYSDNTPYEKIGDEEPVCISDKLPFDIPDSWVWVRHNSFFEISGGSQPPKDKFITSPRDGYIRLYQIRDYGKSPVPVYIPISTATKTTKKGDILLARYGASLGKVFFAEDGAYNVAMAKVIPLFSSEWIDKNYMFLYYHSSLYQDIIFSNSRSAQAGFNKDDLDEMFLPIPPINEQKRIVEKYFTLLPLIEKYDIAHNDLLELNNEFPDNLRKSILQMAVQGKLVSQDPSDEPASVLLERIKVEKQRLVQEGKIKKDKSESIIFRRDNSHYEKLDSEERCIDDKIPFDIPDTWEWVRFSSVIELQSGQDMTPDKYNASNKGVPYITGASNIENGKVIINRWTEFPIAVAYKGDLLLTCKGTVGTMAILEESEVHIARQIMAIRPISLIDIDYVQIVLSSLVEALKAVAKSMIPGISREDVLHALLPLPPLEEQKRIVEKIEAILPLLNGV